MSLHPEPIGAIPTETVGIARDSRGQTIDFLLSAKRDAEAAKRFFRKALAQPHAVNPRSITVDKNAAYPKAIGGDEEGRRALASITAAAGEVSEQHHRAAPPACETPDPARAWLQ